MPRLKDAIKTPDMKKLQPILHPADPIANPAPTPTPNPGSMPNYESLSLAPAPPVLSLDVDRQRQFYRPGVSQYRISPLPVKANQQVGAVASTVATQIVQKAIDDLPTDIESIAINKQTGTDYTVQVNDLNTLITFDNNSGGVITLPGPTTGTFALVQTKNFNANAQFASTTIANGQGNLMILMVTISDGGASVPTVVDTSGNLWTMIATEPDGGNIPTSFWYAFNIKGTPTNTITVTNPSSAVFCLPTVLEYSGFGITDPLDDFSIHEDASSSVTTGANDCLVYNGIRFPGASNPASIAGFTSQYTDINTLIQDQSVPMIGTTIVGNSTPPVQPGSGAICFTGSFKTTVGPSAEAFPIGWFTYIQNTGTGTFMLTSKAQIDNSLNTVLIGPGQGLLVVYDGFNWFTDRGMGLSASSLFYQIIQSAGVDQPQEHKLNFLAPFVVTDNPGNNSTDIGTTSPTAAVEINGVGVSLDKQFFINGVADGATIWGVNINGVPDGG